MIHLSKIFIIAETLPEFSIDFITKKGEKIHVDRCKCTSFHSTGNTMNIKCLESGEVRTLLRESIISINNEEVVL